MGMLQSQQGSWTLPSRALFISVDLSFWEWWLGWLYQHHLGKFWKLQIPGFFFGGYNSVCKGGSPGMHILREDSDVKPVWNQWSIALLWLMGICLKQAGVRYSQACCHVGEALETSKSSKWLDRILWWVRVIFKRSQCFFVPLSSSCLAFEEQPQGDTLSIPTNCSQKRNQFCMRKTWFLIPLFLPSKSPLSTLPFFSGSWPCYTSFLWSWCVSGSPWWGMGVSNFKTMPFAM